MSVIADTLDPGKPYPLGASSDGLGVNFAVFSAHAERIDLCVFDPTGRREIARLPLPECTDEVWHGYLPNARAGLLYGYRAYGPYRPHEGHRFNPHKLLLDPYARRMSGHVRWTDALFGYRVASPRADLSFDRRDSAAGMPKAVVTDDSFNWADDRPPRTPWADTVIYEAHPRGLTMLCDSIRTPERGTFAALGDPAVLDHLRRLGLTAIELMPIHAFVQDRHLLEKGLRNYWGYNTLGFFAPEARYLSNGDLNEIRVAVRRLHAAGIEVILDVVYNHTAEGSELGPTLSYRGLDNASYYRLLQEDPRHCVNDTGTGNTFNLSHPRVIQLVLDSLRYWVTSFHVDGFRFDLGVTLGREAHGFDPGAGFFDALRQDPVLSQVKLISEPWDVGPGGYQLGHHPPGFAEWNDRFRDGARRFWRGDTGQRAEIAARLAGSSDFFDRRARRPWASVNYVAAHDGFTLLDLVSYADRHNEANGEGNSDGASDNLSANWGVEGATDDDAINETRRRVQRALLATMFMAAGTPMLLAGDEFGRSQGGNNNAYCQDNEISWLDWTLAKAPRGEALFAYTRRLIALRHAHPILRCRKFLHGRDELAPGLPDIDWFDERGERLTEEAWTDGAHQLLMLRRASVAGDGSIDIFLMMLNPLGEDREFVLPPPASDARLLLDSAQPDRPEGPAASPLAVPAHGVVLVHCRLPAPGAASDAPRFGPAATADGRTRFRLWAPQAGSVALDIDGRGTTGMSAGAGGWFEAVDHCRPGEAYRFRIDGDLAVPDPAARAQRGGVHGWSLVPDPNAYRWRNAAWRGRPWREAVIYELHAGACGGYAGVAAKLPDLAGLGVTAVELMPVNAFPGRRNWGYDGVLPFAPAEAYGSPDDLKALVDAAHGHGLMVLLDVVYNHFGPDGNYLPSYARDFFRPGGGTAWGDAIDFGQPEVRRYFTENALYWLDEFRFDGLRFDAVHAIGAPDWLEDTARAVRARFPDRLIHLVLENDDNDARLLAKGFDAQWNDDLHHVLHVLLTGETDGYYRDYADAPAKRLARALAHGFVYQGEPSAHRGGRRRGVSTTGLKTTAFVAFLQNHDQIGNRAFGERLTALADPQALEAAIALQCLSPQIPLIFMGEETASRSPFLFFTDHDEPLAAAVREGRTREFQAFDGFARVASQRPLPDPNSPDTFEASLPRPDAEAGPARHALYRRLLELRRTVLMPHLDRTESLDAVTLSDAAVLARWRLGAAGTLAIAANFAPHPAACGNLGGRLLHESRPGGADAVRGGALPARCTVVMLDAPS